MNGLRKEYESDYTVIENSMESFPGLSFDDVVFKLTKFDDKLQTYETCLSMGGYNNRGRGQSYGRSNGNRYRNTYSIRGIGFQ